MEEKERQSKVVAEQQKLGQEQAKRDLDKQLEELTKEYNKDEDNEEDIY